MIVERVESDLGHTWVRVYPDEAHQRARFAHEVMCADFDYTEQDGMQPPTARVSLLGTNRLSHDDVRRLAAEYAEVADVAEQLQNEKRAAYVARFTDTAPQGEG